MSRSTPHETALADHGLTVTAIFVPQSVSRNAGDKNHSINWKVTMHRNGKPVITTDYSQGCGHAPAYRSTDYGAAGIKTVARDEALRHECETGRTHAKPHRPLTPPSASDVMSALLTDADVLNYSDFADWANEFGYDSDSIAARDTYNACLDIALKLRAGIGDDTIRTLAEVFADF